MKLKSILILIFILLFSGCIKKFDSDGLTLKIDESELNTSSKNFPIEKNFVFANVNIHQPQIKIKNENRLNASLNIDFSAILIPSSQGVFELSGVPYFDKEKSSIFLKDIKIEKLELVDMKLNKDFINLFVTNMTPVFNTIFNTIPIYTIEKNSFKGTFVKDVKIEDSELLVTFGL